MSSFSATQPSFHTAPLTSFSVQTDAEPTTLARVLEVFALRTLMPTRFHSVIDGAADPGAVRPKLSVDIQVADLDAAAAEAIARKLNAVVGVRSVLMAERSLGASCTT